MLLLQAGQPPYRFVVEDTVSQAADAVEAGMKSAPTAESSRSVGENRRNQVIPVVPSEQLPKTRKNTRASGLIVDAQYSSGWFLNKPEISPRRGMPEGYFDVTVQR